MLHTGAACEALITWVKSATTQVGIRLEVDKLDWGCF